MKESLLERAQYKVLLWMFDGVLPQWVSKELPQPITSQWLAELEDRLLFDINWRLEWEKERMGIHPRYQEQLPILPDVISPQDITQLLQELNNIKKTFANRAAMFFFRKTSQYTQEQKQSQLRIEVLNQKKIIYEQQIKDRNDQERIEKLSAHKRVAIIIMFLKKDVASQLLEQMTDEEIQAVTLELSQLERPTRAMVEHVIHTFISDIHKTISSSEH